MTKTQIILAAMLIAAAPLASPVSRAQAPDVRPGQQAHPGAGNNRSENRNRSENAPTPGRGSSLSQSLSQSGGVVNPPQTGDHSVIAPPSNGNTPVIPPPGTPGGAPNVHPK